MKELYLTHNNGDRPYMIIVNGKKAEIFKRNKSKKYQVSLMEDYNILVASFPKVKKVFVGNIPKVSYENSILGDLLGTEKTAVVYDKRYMDRFEGNTILIHVRKFEYVFVEDCVYAMNTKGDKILDFISPVRNNDVPYPVAYGENYVYFLTSGFEDQRVSRSVVPVRLLDPQNAVELTGIYLKGERISFLDQYWRGKEPLNFNGYKSKIPTFYCMDSD